MERVRVDTAFRQCPVAERVTAACADRLSDSRLRDIPYRQVQDMLHAVHSMNVLLDLYISVGLFVRMTAPDEVITRTDRYRCRDEY